jgi:hypothetical protein
VLFTILAANGLVLNKETCVFAVSELNSLGHRISAAGVAPLWDNLGKHRKEKYIQYMVVRQIF